MTNKFSIAILFGLLSLSSANAQTVIPLEDFFKESAFDEPKISPDGSKMAVVAQWKDHKALAVIDLKTKQPQILTAPETFDVAAVRWMGNTRLIFNGVEPAGFANTRGINGGLFAIDVDGKNSRTLCDSYGSKGAKNVGSGRYMGRFGNSITEVLITNNERLMSEPDVFRMNVHTGAKRMVARNPGNVRGWLADHAGIVRIAHKQVGLDHSLLYRKSDNTEWREVKKWKFTEGSVDPIEFDENNKLLYVSSNIGRDTSAIYLMDPETGEILKELYSNDTYDVENVILSRADHRLLGYQYDGDRPTYAWVDKETQELQAMIDQELPDDKNIVYSSSEDRTWVVIASMSDRNPGVFYLFNKKQLTLEKIITQMEWIKREQMSEMRPISYRARDGVTIHGYLTLPNGKEHSNLPLIVNPHGGPWARDSWGFNREVQFLANRGYAVLQMNFRGSTGLGKKLLESGYGQWGLSMQDDITDAVRWAIAQGYANPKRVAIYGASYGGYATMAGLAFTPELYRCGVNYVGVTDIKLFLKTIPESWEIAREELELKAGNAKRDSGKLDAVSPLENASNIKVPVFFAYGELDPRVDLKHGTRFISKLKSNGIPVEVMIKNNEEHGYHELNNQIDFYTTMERFLSKYME